MRFIAEKDLKFGFMNFYYGDSSTISSCCFDGKQEVLVKTREETKRLSFKELYDSLTDKAEEVVVAYRGNWVSAKLVRLPKRNMYKVTTLDDRILYPTEDHLHPTLRGDVRTDELTTDDYLLLDSVMLGDTQGLWVGEYWTETSSDNQIEVHFEWMREIEDVYKTKDSDIYVKIKAIEPIESSDDYVYCFEMENQNDPYFTLANGVITHNCRLRSSKRNEYFNSFGAGSSKIGSQGVVTPNFVRMAIESMRDGSGKQGMLEKVRYYVDIAGKVNNAKREIIKRRIEGGSLPLYSLGFMELNKQYSTCGVNGLYEALQVLGLDVLTKEGQDFQKQLIQVINETNDELEKLYKAPHNCEQVPGENMSIKSADKDRLLGYQDKWDLYSNQFIPLIVRADLFDRMKLQGEFDSMFSGGSVFHANVDNPIPDVDTLYNMMLMAAKLGVVYWAINYNEQECENGHQTVGMNKYCPKCSGKIVANYTRVVGFLTKVDNWHKTRREKDYPKRQWYRI